MQVHNHVKPSGLQQAGFSNSSRRSYVGGPYFGENTDNKKSDSVELSAPKVSKKSKPSLLQGVLLGAAALMGGSFFLAKPKG